MSLSNYLCPQTRLTFDRRFVGGSIKGAMEGSKVGTYTRGAVEKIRGEINMKHDMSLFEGSFNSVKNKEKIIEVRLNDEKRKKINVGDVITFYKLPEKEEKLTSEVLDKYSFQSFEELYSEFDFSVFGCRGYTMKSMIDETYDIYTREQERRYGALGIKIRLI